MAPLSKSWELPVDDRINHIAVCLGDHDEFSDKGVPGLKSLLDDYISPDVDVDNVTFARRMLKVFKDSETDNTYSTLLRKHSADEQHRIERFVAGESPEELGDGFVLGPSLGCREELQKLEDASSIVHVTADGVMRVKDTINAIPQELHDWFNATISKLESFGRSHEDNIDKAGIVVYHNAEFQNWGLTVKNTPSLTCVPKTVKDIQVIVKFAKEHKMSVRCSGYRHSWSPVFAKSGNILVSMLDINVATVLPNTAALPLPESKPTELETIEMVSVADTDSSSNSLVRIGAGVTNERLRRWCVQNNKVTIPLNVIMVEITIGGSNAPICHGAGRKNRTLSDLVRKVEYIDAHGELQVVEKPEHLRAASGCFGLMGIVTHLTLEFSRMTYALLEPLKIPVICAVPPPPDLDEKDIPPVLYKAWKKLTPDKKKFYQEDFERRANNDYYSEWFWFPYSDNAWVNTWNNTKDGNGAKSFPNDTHIFLSFVQSFTMNVLQNTPLMGKLITYAGLSEAAVTLLSRFAMMVLPDTKVKTYLTDALHFQRAIQNVRVRDMEVEIPLVAKAGTEDVVDYSPVQRAWWDAVLSVYKNSKTCPMRMPLEMRIMGGSDVIMAPQRGNKLGTCAIEVLTLCNAADIWLPFAQEVLTKWMGLKDPTTKQSLKTRSHWAKEWYSGLKVNGKPWIEHMKNVDYKAERQEFVNILADIGREAGWTLDDVKARFSNELFDDIFFGSDLVRKIPS